MQVQDRLGWVYSHCIIPRHTVRSSEKGATMAKERKWLRIRELERLSGVRRRTILFYLQAGLLHPPVKTGKTMAYYDEVHLRKLACIRKARSQGLPLVAIRQRIENREREGDPVERRDPGGSLPRKGFVARAKRPRSARSQGTRQKILEVGTRLFRQKGYQNMSVSDITRDLGIGKGSFYYYFSDKKELFLECVPRLFEELFSSGWEQIRKEKDPLRRIERRARIVAPVIRDFCTILKLCREALEDADSKMNSLGKGIFESVCRPIESDIRKGIELGSFRAVDPKIVSILLIGIIESLDYLLVMDPDLSVETFKDAVIDLIGKGLKRTGRQRSQCKRR